jgi:hypothetical protein
MNRAYFWITGVGLSLSFGTLAAAGPRIVDAGDPAVADVRAVAADFLTKVSEHDGPGAKALFAGPDDQAELLDVELKFAEAAEQLGAALPAAPPQAKSFARMLAVLLRQRTQLSVRCHSC